MRTMLRNIGTTITVVLLCGMPILLTRQTSRTLADERPEPDAVALKHIKNVIQSLPVGSSLRRSLQEVYVTHDTQKRIDDMKRSTSSAIMRRAMEEAVLPDGIHKPWMDDMQRLGVKLAMFQVRGLWRDSVSVHVQPQATKRIIYRKKYDGPGSQIMDARELAQINESGLEAELQGVAFEKSKKAISITIDSPPKERDSCIVDIYLYDDEWLIDHALGTNSPQARCGGNSGTGDDTLGYGAAMGDLLTVRRQLSTQKFSHQDLDATLFEALAYPSDNTDVMTLLLKAGANVNARRLGGSTPLMDAVARLNLSNIKLLLSSGADVSLKTTDGSTAYSLAMQQIKQFQESGTHPPDYMPEMLKLLKPPGSAL